MLFSISIQPIQITECRETFSQFSKIPCRAHTTGHFAGSNLCLPGLLIKSFFQLSTLSYYFKGRLFTPLLYALSLHHYLLPKCQGRNGSWNSHSTFPSYSSRQHSFLHHLLQALIVHLSSDVLFLSSPASLQLSLHKVPRMKWELATLAHLSFCSFYPTNAGYILLLL
mmetsp:Transcript_29619/g.68956  ORF Transcript_29619/g.68956 Transcript_29619/m.68956 type:complete len:168 (-) Transcript_29619:182-685(-)